ncbi:hypothetical protein IX51_03890 [uncultured archaeon]|nr:hypothetical protein IX51_03890 [uncultured archaeon]
METLEQVNIRSRSPRVVVLVLNWNGLLIKYQDEPILKQCLDNLRSTNYSNLDVVLVDASSSDGSKEYVEQNFETVHVLTVDNISWSYNNNRGLEHIFGNFPDAEYVVMMSNDIIAYDRNWLSRFLDPIEGNDSIGIASCKLVDTEGRTQYTGLRLAKYGGFEPVTSRGTGFISGDGYIVGAFFLMNARMLRKIGFLDESYVMMGSEDTDICERARLAGYKIFYEDDVVLSHIGSASTFSLSDEIEGRWDLKELKFNMRVNNYVFLLRWRKSRVPFFLLYDAASTIIRIKPKIHLNRPLFSGIVESFTSLLRAVQLYRTTKIKFPKN